MKPIKRKDTKFVRELPKDAEPITFLGHDKEGVMQAADKNRVYDCKGSVLIIALALLALVGIGTGIWFIGSNNTTEKKPVQNYYTNTTPSNLSDHQSPTPVPEPGTLALLGSALVGGYFMRRKK